MAGQDIIFSASVFLGVLTLLLGSASYADQGLIGGGQQTAQAESCIDANNTVQNIDCAISQGEQISGLVSSGENRMFNLVILIPLSIVIAYLVIIKIIIPAIPFTGG